MWRKKKPKGPPPLRTNVGGDPLPISIRSSPLVGYRIWQVKPVHRGTSLWSLNTHYEWEVHNQAQCLPPAGQWFMGPLMAPEHDHPASFVECSCGFYVALPDQPIGEWEQTVWNRVYASGSVALTGRVLRCEMGFKSEWAEILSPVVLNVACAASGDCLEDVTQVDLQSNYARGWCAQHAPGVGVIVEAAQYMKETARQLEARYEGIEFISWFEGGV